MSAAQFLYLSRNSFGLLLRLLASMLRYSVESCPFTGLLSRDVVEECDNNMSEMKGGKGRSLTQRVNVLLSKPEERRRDLFLAVFCSVFPGVYLQLVNLSEAVFILCNRLLRRLLSTSCRFKHPLFGRRLPG